jgi:hypothetical protein
MKIIVELPGQIWKPIIFLFSVFEYILRAFKTEEEFGNI